MSYKKNFLQFILISSLLASCSTRKSLDLYDESSFWITDKSHIIINNFYSDKLNNPVEHTPYVMYNYNDSGYTLYSRPLPTGVVYRLVFLEFYISKLNGLPNNLGISSCKYTTPKKVDRTLEYIPITEPTFQHYEDISLEEKRNIESFFSGDTKITKYDLKKVYLINRCNYYLSNEDVQLSASETQFSFSTGIMKDEKGEEINIILKCTSNTTFKIYKFNNREEVGEVLLEGTMSNIIQKDKRMFSINFETISDYYFNGKYNKFTLSIRQHTNSDSQNNQPNFNFIFPEDVD